MRVKIPRLWALTSAAHLLHLASTCSCRNNCDCKSWSGKLPKSALRFILMILKRFGSLVWVLFPQTIALPSWPRMRLFLFLSVSPSLCVSFSLSLFVCVCCVCMCVVWCVCGLLVCVYVYLYLCIYDFIVSSVCRGVCFCMSVSLYPCLCLRLCLCLHRVCSFGLHAIYLSPMWKFAYFPFFFSCSWPEAKAQALLEEEASMAEDSMISVQSESPAESCSGTGEFNSSGGSIYHHPLRAKEVAQSFALGTNLWALM